MHGQQNKKKKNTVVLLTTCPHISSYTHNRDDTIQSSRYSYLSTLRAQHCMFHNNSTTRHKISLHCMYTRFVIFYTNKNSS